MLVVLAGRPGEVVTREELRAALWGAETFVDAEAGLNTAIAKLREALGDSAESPRFIETIPKRGYRFIGPATSAAATSTRPFPRGRIGSGSSLVSSCWPSWPPACIGDRARRHRFPWRWFGFTTKPVTPRTIRLRTT
jgi:hypothetical protein